jgi:hypothetical protein
MKFSCSSFAAALLSIASLAAHAADAPGVTKIPVTFSGGHETDPRDHGRPVVLVAAGLGVAPEVFRDAFSGVRPAGPGSGGPTREEAQKNKQALMSVLAKYGIKNERLDEVSNYYRYQPQSGRLWRNEPAEANAIVKNGMVTGYEVVRPGAGYSTPPAVSVPGYPNATAKVELSFGKQLEKNGSVAAVNVAK